MGVPCLHSSASQHGGWLQALAGPRMFKMRGTPGAPTCFLIVKPVRGEAQKTQHSGKSRNIALLLLAPLTMRPTSSAATCLIGHHLGTVPPRK
jgi:hypothetical protein